MVEVKMDENITVKDGIFPDLDERIIKELDI